MPCSLVSFCCFLFLVIVWLTFLRCPVPQDVAIVTSPVDLTYFIIDQGDRMQAPCLASLMGNVMGFWGVRIEVNLADDIGIFIQYRHRYSWIVLDVWILIFGKCFTY